jgi:hypothetical protein
VNYTDRLETFSKLFFPSTIRSWNSLDPNFKSIQTTSKFKQTLRANLFKVSNVRNHYFSMWTTNCKIKYDDNNILVIFQLQSFLLTPILYFIYLVHGNWGTWQEWNSCSATCGSGSRSRRLECNNPEPAFGGSDCQGNDTEIESCSIKLCPGKF